MPRRGPPRYRRLADYLATLPPNITTVTLTLPAIEAVLGAPLPPGARGLRFWANAPEGWAPSPPAWAWHGAGWRVARFDRPAGAVTFARADSTV